MSHQGDEIVTHETAYTLSGNKEKDLKYDLEDEGDMKVTAAGDGLNSIDQVDATEEMMAKQDLEVFGADLDAVEAKLSEMSITRAYAIAVELVKLHKHDQNFPQEALNRLEDFVTDYQQIIANPEDHRTMIQEVKMECLLSTENSPYLEVRANTETTDDPSIPTLTFRVWLIGTLFASAGCFIDVLFSFRQPPVFVGTTVGQLLAYPLGTFMAKVLPHGTFSIFGYRMSLNPGPFNAKEHMLITIMCNVSLSAPYTAYIIPVQALSFFFNQAFARNFGYQFMNTLGTNFVGYGLAGLCRRFLVWPSYAVWPATFNNMALIKAFHSKTNETVRGPWGRMLSMTRERFFLWSFLAMAIYYFLPGYLFQALSLFSWMSWISPNNTKLDAVTGLLGGMGLNPWMTFDWNVASATGIFPLTLPTFSIVNIFLSQLVATFVIFAVWWSNLWNTAYLPINSNNTWDNTGNLYNVSAILNSQGEFDDPLYQAYSQPWMSAAFVVDYIFYFTMYTATVTYVILFHGYELKLAFIGFWRAVRSTIRRTAAEPSEAELLTEDVHSRLMRQNYKDVPEWVYGVVLIIAMVIGMVGIGIYPDHTSPVVVIYGIILPLFCMIPAGLIQAVTGFTVPTNVLAEFIGGSFVQGNANALMYFKTYGYISCYQALLFSNDLKLAHYTKLPPWHTFAVQMWGTFINSLVSAAIYNFVLGLKDVCTANGIFRFTCPGQTVYFTAAVFWGTLSPKRLFGEGKRYNTMLIGFPAGVVLVLVYWLARRRFPRVSWLRQLHPVLLCEGPIWIAAPYNIGYFYSTLYITLFSFQFVRKRYTEMWAKYNYVLSASFSCGVAVSAVIIFFALDIPNGGLSVDWWGNSQPFIGCEASGGCPLYTELPSVGYFGPPKGMFT